MQKSAAKTKKKNAKNPAPKASKKKAGKGKAASHDQPYPPKLIDFMLSGWKSPSGALPKPIKSAEAHRARRANLSKAFKGEMLVIPTGHEKVRANDTNYRFRPGTEFFYLTGNDEADCVLVLKPVKGGHEHVLYVEPNPGRSDSTFFTDRHKGELWVGPSLGVPEHLSLSSVIT